MSLKNDYRRAEMRALLSEGGIAHCPMHATYAPRCGACWHAAYGVEMNPKSAGVVSQENARRGITLMVCVVALLVAVAVVIAWFGGAR